MKGMKHSRSVLSAGLLMAALFLGATSAQAAKVLVLGDQRLKTEFGTRLDEKLKTLPDAQVTTFSACDSNPDFWIEGSTTQCGYFERLPNGTVREAIRETVPPLVTLLSERQPKYTLLVTGEMDLRTGANRLQNQMRAVSQAVRSAGSTCLWIGPELSRSEGQYEKYYKALRVVAEESECALVDAPLLSQLVDAPNALFDVILEMLKLGEDPSELD